MKSNNEQSPRYQLGRRLWVLMEEPQSYAFVSGLVDGLPDDQVLNIARGSLVQHERCVKKLREFIRRNSESRA